ncbi:hypothetical protein ACIQXD_29725 [Streptomyces uncialis]|uniref:hypothetical protein n=1 Tax=Streptomyces uncialis TaxID=1048205 RepID=UPI003804265E
MPPEVLAWLRAQLGTTTPADDLAARYARLGTARAVAGEVLAERRAALLADPLRITVPGAVTLDHSANLSGLERQLAALDELSAPDDVTEGGAVPDLTVTRLVRRFGRA